MYWRKANWDQLHEPCFETWESDNGHPMSCATGPQPLPLPDLVPPTNQRAFCEERSPVATLHANTLVPLDVERFLWARTQQDSALDPLSLGEVVAAAVSATTPSQFWQALAGEVTSQGGSMPVWNLACGDHGLDP